MAQVGSFSSSMPKTIITLIRMPSWKPLNRRLAIIKCNKPTNSGISRGRSGGQTNGIKPQSENNGSLGSSKSENNSNKTNGVGGGTPKKTRTN